jgi:hypothetical protein
VRVLIVVYARGIRIFARSEAGIRTAASAFVGTEGAEGLEAVVDCARELSDCLVVAIGRSKKDDKKRKEQGDEVRVGEQPPIMINRFFSVSCPPHRLATFAKPGRGISPT